MESRQGNLDLRVLWRMYGKSLKLFLLSELSMKFLHNEGFPISGILEQPEN